MTSAAALRALHHAPAPGGGPLVLPGPWDAASARAFADAGFPALATPSAGVAASLGYADGETPAAEMFAAVARIARAVDVPVSADVEDGYGLAPRELVGRLLEAGAAGCNLEDGDRASGLLKDSREQADFLAAVRAEAGDALVVNARVDTFLKGDADPEPAIARGRLYAAAGADCLYPILAPPPLLAALAEAVGLPVNALALPDGPSPHELGRLGAARVTFGGGLHGRAMAGVAETAARLAAGLWGEV
ncbi:isocitrate lyase/PEP mutase family protein [Streptomyces albireticuli]|uniref:Carboxyvinyl-carboxyphosphonate phosphorylmutase n=1 Tax=Streptomyces albireticuli TaxID=1940 RepID=A0A2A2CZ43_9ACTN|nr:isocitrate lyase/phosphoenolpyruvate mutase family protein [Streptomyces albireticuli]MCD9142827.1 isocitrate lyase/phosphoenolpyruvate mutase family protein [Streptomyces albireticuli]MCD9162854.1 isocitrate lyase/phosphoenolpyruvate mutase family protein [Streptomyces albireticuli]MCD9192414.1 isocitrate lyase/phosphoenolpyruvate mutase family protein [Streptomyces albireticuli]PAU44429.1 carboxyvinyl-carboxyphosphonate phosphorylmutase [Streptomyces albireticuli]